MSRHLACRSADQKKCRIRVFWMVTALYWLFPITNVFIHVTSSPFDPSLSPPPPPFPELPPFSLSPSSSIFPAPHKSSHDLQLLLSILCSINLWNHAIFSYSTWSILTYVLIRLLHKLIYFLLKYISVVLEGSCFHAREYFIKNTSHMFVWIFVSYVFNQYICISAIFSSIHIKL